MKIKQLDIYGYGKWVDKTFHFDDQIQLIYGPNEAGKSTLQSFIRSILFGFPSKRRRVNQINRFEPKASSQYGGRLLLTDTAYGDVWVERTQKGLSLQKTSGDILDPLYLDQILSGLDEKMFDTFYAFSLANLQEIANLDGSQINDYFLSIGTYGSDTFVRVARQLEKESDALYRPQGQNRPINKALNELEALEKKAAIAQQESQTYDTLVQERLKESKAIQSLNEELNQLESTWRQTDRLIDRYDAFLKEAANQRELQALVFTPMDSQAADRLKQSKQNIVDLQIAIAEKEERIRLYQGELGAMTRLNWAINHEEDRQVWLAKTQEAKEVQSKIEYLQGRILEQEEMMADLARRGHFDPDRIKEDQASQALFDLGLAHEAERINLDQEANRIQSELNIYLGQRQDQQHYSATVRSQRAKLENQRLNEEALLIESTSLKHYFLGAAFTILGLFLLLSAGLAMIPSSTLITTLAWVLLLIGVSSCLYVLFGHRQKLKTFYQSPILDKIQDLKEREQTYLDQAKQVAQQINEREGALRTIDQAKAEVDETISDWLYQMGYEPSADASEVLRTNPAKAYFQAKQKRDQFIQEKDQADLLLIKWRELLQPLFERFPYQETNIRMLLRYVEDLEAQLKVTQYRGLNLNEKVEENKEAIMGYQSQMRQEEETIEAILKEVDAENELDFYNKLTINDRIRTLESQSVLYQEQIRGFEDQLSKVESKQALNEEVKRLEIQMQHIKDRLEGHQHQRANLEVQIRHLESDGTYQNLQQAIEVARTQVKDQIFTWVSKRLAMTLIEETLRQGIEDPLPKMIKLANQLFDRLSFGRYKQILMTADKVRVVQFSGISFEPHELSQGTLEQLYVALRLAFIETATHMVKLPILIDDAFVNFDETRKEAVYQVLGQLAADYQILFFTFDSHAKDLLSQASLIDLSPNSEE